MRKIYSLILAGLLVSGGSAVAQDGVASSTTVNVSPGQTYQIPSAAADAAGIKCESCVFDGSYLIAGSDTVFLKADEHSDLIVAMAILPSKPKTVTFYSGRANGEVSFDFFKTSSSKIPSRKGATFRTGTDDCNFSVVPTSVWRAGLDDPTWGTKFTQTEIVAVHHGASANISTYAQAVSTIRQYYLLHRNTNKWGDIGYNYLIGPEGTVFQGREIRPGQTFTSDYIQGAHLCSKNVGTMGICMMGDFTNVLPTAKALESLYKVIKWKMKKDNLDIDGRTYHYGNIIPNIIGHREGPCATACPGDALYRYLFAGNRLIKTEVGNICEAPLGLTADEMNYIVIVYPNPSNGQELRANFDYKTVAVHSIDGKLVRKPVKKSGDILPVSGLTAGTYFLHFDTPDYGKVVRRILIN